MRVYTKEVLERLATESNSLAQILKKLNITPAGGNYKTLKIKLKEFSISTKHFTGQTWSLGRKFGPRRKLDYYLVNGKSIGSDSLRRRLLNDRIFDRKCYKCLNTQWLGNPISLELEHINGDNVDNRLENLTILCPNCHAQTGTYRGKNIKRSGPVAELANAESLKDSSPVCSTHTGATILK